MSNKLRKSTLSGGVIFVSNSGQANWGTPLALVNVYIDGFNLFYGALKHTPFKWLDLSALCTGLLPGDLIQEIHYFTARVSSRPYNPTAAHDQSLYLRALKTIPNLQIKHGRFNTHSVPMYLTNVNPPQKVWVDKTEEKGSDVNLASRLLWDSFNKRFEVALLITNDSDLAEPVRIVAQDLRLPVGILNPHMFHSRELRQYATFIKRIRQGDLAASQFPRVMTDRKGQFVKPIGW